MLIEFSLQNYRSFHERVTLSMVAANITSKPDTIDTTNRFQATPTMHLLTSAVLYGANASGKTNLIKAINVMRLLILTSSQDIDTTKRLSIEPFLLNSATPNEPSFFEMVFRVQDTQYRYGFEMTKQRVMREWLYVLSSSRESKLFTREQQHITVSPRLFREGKGLEKHTRDTALFLSVVAQLNGETATTVRNWFGKLIVSIGMEQNDVGFAVLRHEDSHYRDAIEQLVKRLDVGIVGFELQKEPMNPPENILDFPPDVAEKWLAFVDALKHHGDNAEQRDHVRVTIKTRHQRFNADGQPHDEVAFDLAQESDGTQRLFAFAEHLIHTLKHGLVLVVDELDARIHPNLVIALLRLFHLPTTNPHHAQLVFTTHNTNLLSSQLFRRDQVWFTEKTQRGATDLYSLVEYKVDGKIIRSDASFEKNYIEGRYGAIPFLGDLEQLIGAHVEQKKNTGIHTTTNR